VRYRKLDANGDYTFGQGLNNFWIDVSQAVAQAIQTRLNLWQGEWFLDTTAGLSIQQILGYNTKSLYDAVIRAQILGTSGVTSILEYGSSYDPEDRSLTVSGVVQTQYSQPTSFTAVLTP
jgi:hypothetical protein